MAYSPSVTYKGEVARAGHRSLEVDVTYNATDTELAGVGDTLDLSHTEGPKGTSTYKAPVSVEVVRLKTPDAGDNNVAITWDTANDDTTNGTVRVKIVNDDAVTANGLRNLQFRVLMHFRTLKAGGTS